MKRLSRLALLAALFAAPFAAALEAQPFRMIIAEAETPLVPNSVMELAKQGGYFERAGVDVEFIRVAQSPMVMAALRAGEGEMANLSLEALLQARDSGATDLRGVMSPDKSLPFLIAAKDVTALADLSGKRFGIGRVGSVDHMLSMRVLHDAGVDTASLQLFPIGQPQNRAQALLAGQIDATTMGIGTFTALGDAPGLSVLVSAADYFKAAPILTKLNVVRLDTLDSRSAEVEAVIEALTLAARDFQADPAKWVSAMQKARPDIAAQDLEFLAQAFRQSWSVNGGLTPASVQKAQAWLHEGEDFSGKTPADLDSFTDFRPLEAVLQKIGPSDAGDMAGL